MNSDIFDLVPGTAEQGGNLTQSWRQINDARGGVRKGDYLRTLARDQAALIRRRMMMASDQMFPFKVYLYQRSLGPTAMAAAFTDSTTWWRQFLVRSGRVQNVPMAAPNGGCDLYDTDPYSDFISAGGSLTPISVPTSTSAFYIWFEVVSGTPQLRFGTNITSGTHDTIPWTIFPATDGIHGLIAVINTTSPYQAIIRQIACADIQFWFKEYQCCYNDEGTDTTGYVMLCGSAPYSTSGHPDSP